MKPGDSIGGKYRLGRILGEGGMGSVWAANNELIGRDVAIKVMLPELAKNQDALQRFFKEARICASIRDPGIVDVLDLGTAEDGSPFIVMELLAGEPLETVMKRSRQLPVEQAVTIVRDVAQTLCLAHEKGVVHRDLKPANLFLQRPHKGVSQVKILDFGISKVMNDTNAYATRTGAVLGSPAYMSPEQAAGRPIDFRTDIYSLGVILYEALAGHIPFYDCPNTNALLVAIATQDPPPLATFAPHVPPFVVEIIERAMRRAPLDRYGSIAEFAQALDGAQRQLMSVSVSRPSFSVIARSHSSDTAISNGPATAATNFSPTTQQQYAPAQPSQPLPFAQAPVAPSPSQPGWGGPQYVGGHSSAPYHPQIQHTQVGPATVQGGRPADAITAAPLSRTHGPAVSPARGTSRALVAAGVVGGLAIGITVIAVVMSKQSKPTASASTSDSVTASQPATTTATTTAGPKVEVAPSATSSAAAPASASAAPVASTTAAPTSRPVTQPGLPPPPTVPPPTVKKRNPYDEF